FTQPIEQRLNEMISGARGDLAVKIYGDDFDVLRDKAEQIEKILKEIRGSADVQQPDAVSGLPVVEVKVRPEVSGRHGLSARVILDHVEALGGKRIGQITEGQLRFPLALRLPRGLRRDPEAFGAMLIETPKGERIPLSRLAEINRVEGPAK